MWYGSQGTSTRDPAVRAGFAGMVFVEELKGNRLDVRAMKQQRIVLHARVLFWLERTLVFATSTDGYRYYSTV